jgi:hypothetical protein
MTVKKILHLLLTLFMMTTFVSCGDLFMKKNDDDEKLNQFATCELDTEALAKIFTENIRGELLCLEQNLNLFIDVVRTDRPGNLSLKELKLYIDKHIDGVAPEVIEGLDAVFEMNSVISGDHKQYIARANVHKLIGLFIDINKIMVDNNVFEYFSTDERVTYSEHNRRKAKVFMALTEMASSIKAVQKVEGNYSSLNLVDIIKTFENEDNQAVLEKIESLMFLKKVFLGGEVEILTAEEFSRMADMLADGGKVAFDIIHLDNIEHSENEEEEIILTLKEDFESLVRNLYYDPQVNAPVMTIYDIVNAINHFVPEMDQYTKYTSEMLKIKHILLDSAKPEFTANEVQTLLERIILENLRRGAFFYRAYELNRDILEAGTPITNDLENFFYMDENEKRFKDDFNRVARSYRFFRGREMGPKYRKFIRRSALGMFEVAVMEDIAKRVFSFYGDKLPSAKGGYRLKQPQLQTLMFDFQAILEGEDILFPGRIMSTSETILMMTGLFQSHSDGDSDIEIDEMVQFVITLLTSFGTQTTMMPEIKKLCPLDHKDRFEPSCFRENFLDLMKLDTGKNTTLDEHFPKLVEFLEGLSDTDKKKYIKTAESFSRSCMEYNGQVVKMTEGDIFLLFGGLGAVEQTMIRFDLNENNNLEPAELDEAYKVYESAIKALIPGKFLKRFAKSFFLYLVKYKKVPDVEGIDGWKSFWKAVREGVHFVGFLLKRNKYSEQADRFTLAAILQTLSDYSDAEPFPCHLLVDDPDQNQNL